MEKIHCGSRHASAIFIVMSRRLLICDCGINDRCGDRYRQTSFSDGDSAVLPSNATSEGCTLLKLLGCKIKTATKITLIPRSTYEIPEIMQIRKYFRGQETPNLRYQFRSNVSGTFGVQDQMPIKTLVCSNHRQALIAAEI
jgi:hypothetical protein